MCVQNVTSCREAGSQEYECWIIAEVFRGTKTTDRQTRFSHKTCSVVKYGTNGDGCRETASFAASM